MRYISLVFFLIILNFNSFSQEFNFDKVGLYDNIKEINHFEVIHNSKSNDTNQLNYYSYNKRGDILEKRFNYRITQSRRRIASDTGKQFLYIDTVGTKKNPAFTTVYYRYNGKGYLIDKNFVNSEPVFLVNEFKSKKTVLVECKYYNEDGFHVSSVVTNKEGEIETHYYEYEKQFIKEKRVYKKEKLCKTVVYEYKYYFVD